MSALRLELSLELHLPEPLLEHLKTGMFPLEMLSTLQRVHDGTLQPEDLGPLLAQTYRLGIKLEQEPQTLQTDAAIRDLWFFYLRGSAFQKVISYKERLFEPVNLPKPKKENAHENNDPNPD